MSRSGIRRLFVGALVVLVVQYGLVGIVGAVASEPWPAIVLPGFKTVYTTSGAVEVPQTTVDVLYADGTRRSMPPATFLSLLPRSHHSAFLRAQCRPASLSGTAKTERCLSPDGARWFIRRAATLAPEQTIRGVDVVWSRLRYAPNERTATTTPLDTLHIRP